MGQGHAKLNYGDTNTHTKHTLRQTGQTAVDSFYFIRLLIWSNSRKKKRNLSSIVGHWLGFIFFIRDST